MVAERRRSRASSARSCRCPRHFEQAAELVTEDDVAETVVCGPDPEAHRAAIQEYVDAGFDHVYIHQVGPDQEGFLDFYDREILASSDPSGSRRSSSLEVWGVRSKNLQRAEQHR